MGRRAVRLVLACALTVAFLALAGCGEEATMDPKMLEGVEWALSDSSATAADLAAAGMTATFDGTTVAGFSGVNQYSGPYTAEDGGTLEVGELASTMMAGPEPLMSAEQAYLELLRGCDGWAVDGGTLRLTTGGEESLVYEKAAEVELPGTAWTVTDYNNGKGAVTTVVAGSRLTIEFGADGTVSGDGGVNRYHGPFTVEGDAVAIGPLATTKMAGDPELAAQEAMFLKALEASTRWGVVRGKLELRDGDGAAMVFADPAD